MSSSSTRFGDKAFFGGLGKLAGWYGVSRIVQVLCMIVITRALDERDFMVMAAVAAFQGVMTRFTAVNLYAELVRSEELCARQLRVAWSYETLRNMVLVAVLALLAPWIAVWIGRPETTQVFRLSALTLIIASCNNPRMVELRRDAKFGTLGALESVAPIAYGVVGVIIVQFQADYWALVWAGVVSSAIFVVATYVPLRWRPSFDFHWKTVRPMFAFGIVLQVNSICGALKQHGLIYVLILYGLNEEMGYYNRAAAFSLALSMQLMTLVWKVAYPHFSNAEREGRSSIKMAQRMQSQCILYALPVALIGVVAGKWMIPWVLGRQWSPIYETWALMAVASVFLVANAPLGASFQAARKEVPALVLYVGTALVQVGVGFAAVYFLGLEGTGVAILVAAIAGVIISRSLSRRLLAEKESEPPAGNEMVSSEGRAT